MELWYNNDNISLKKQNYSIYSHSSKVGKEQNNWDKTQDEHWEINWASQELWVA